MRINIPLVNGIFILIQIGILLSFASYFSTLALLLARVRVEVRTYLKKGRLGLQYHCLEGLEGLSLKKFRLRSLTSPIL